MPCSKENDVENFSKKQTINFYLPKKIHYNEKGVRRNMKIQPPRGPCIVDARVAFEPPFPEYSQPPLGKYKGLLRPRSAYEPPVCSHPNEGVRVGNQWIFRWNFR
jgi:hypothetical protein